MYLFVSVKFFLTNCNATKNRYQVFQVTPRDGASFGELVKLWHEQRGVFDFWTGPRTRDHPSDVMVPPAFTKSFEAFLQSHKFDYSVKIADVQT